MEHIEKIDRYMNSKDGNPEKWQRFLNSKEGSLWLQSLNIAKVRRGGYEEALKITNGDVEEAKVLLVYASYPSDLVDSDYEERRASQNEISIEEAVEIANARMNLLMRITGPGVPSEEDIIAYRRFLPKQD